MTCSRPPNGQNKFDHQTKDASTPVVALITLCTREFQYLAMLVHASVIREAGARMCVFPCQRVFMSNVHALLLLGTSVCMSQDKKSSKD